LSLRAPGPPPFLHSGHPILLSLGPVAPIISPGLNGDEILAFREQVGEFGTLLYAGKDWLDRERGRRSMILLAEKVLPAVNAAIGA